ncbi:lytic transglycosylase domain-containing protein [Lichenihabitans psoromatis]|uniref:lytic transglycosylase domain-containing protein n=1 Tax=Lichenihabitans psoromatis TaxID=2528642 RepID=UPI0010384CC1|nr:transglycosylase SLT domain-containing protein [Lichenihabitans psoromatis]
MRHLALAGSILLVCLLGLASNASARDRYSAVRDAMPVASDNQPDLLSNRTIEQQPPQRRYRAPLSIAPRGASMANYVIAAARRHGVPEALAYGVASVESGFNPRARSRAGAVGLMGIMPATARGLGCSGALTNPAANAECGVRYLASILSDQGGDLHRTAALYNQGRYAHRISRGGSRYASLVMSRARRLS